MITKSYRELMTLPTFEERFEYLKLDGSVGTDTFGFDRYLNQVFYRSPEWKRIRDIVIARDNGCDLGAEGYNIFGKIIIHHMNPISVNDILNKTNDILDPNYLICVSHRTHNLLHYGAELQLASAVIERRPNDTCPWKG